MDPDSCTASLCRVQAQGEEADPEKPGPAVLVFAFKDLERLEIGADPCETGDCDSIAREETPRVLAEEVPVLFRILADHGRKLEFNSGHFSDRRLPSFCLWLVPFVGTASTCAPCSGSARWHFGIPRHPRCARSNRIASCRTPIRIIASPHRGAQPPPRF
jgi:hypothetical protein